MTIEPPSAKRLEVYEELRASAGWYLAAWRNFRALTQEELANEIGTSKSVISELETGKPKRDGSKPLRFNRDWVDLIAKALGTTGGHLIDINPFATGAEILDLWRRVPTNRRPQVVRLIQAFEDEAGGADVP